MKEILWAQMRADLARYIPDAEASQLLLCPACCRFLPFEHFDIEHIIPRLAVGDDPPEARAAIPKTLRSGVTLLCKKPLRVKGKEVYANGCNSWKGRHYDRFLREMFNPTLLRNRHTSRHSVAIFVVGYLGLFARYGYQITLMPSGPMMRRQFFNPNLYDKEVPVNYQVLLMGDAQKHYSEEAADYWRITFRFLMQPGACLMLVRNVSMYMPLARNPETPIAHVLPLAPLKYAIRPDLHTAFH